MKYTKLRSSYTDVESYPKLVKIANTNHDIIILVSKREIDQYIGTVIYDVNPLNIGYIGSWDKESVRDFHGEVTIR